MTGSPTSGSRSESRGASWSRLSTLCPSSSSSTFLCRSRWTQWWKCRRRPLLLLCRRRRTSWWKSRSSGLLCAMARFGPGSTGPRVCTGSTLPPDTPSGTRRRDTPPGQGATEKLALGDCGRPCDHAVCVPAVQVVRALCRDSVPSTE